jgi:cation transporter-like permease
MDNWNWPSFRESQKGLHQLIIIAILVIIVGILIKNIFGYENTILIFLSLVVTLLYIHLLYWIAYLHRKNSNNKSKD